jgi:hypothetical protein
MLVLTSTSGTDAGVVFFPGVHYIIPVKDSEGIMLERAHYARHMEYEE